MEQEITIYKIYLSKKVPSWPKPDLDLDDEMKRLDGILDGIAKKVKDERGFGVQFVGGDLAYTPKEVGNIESKLEEKSPDGVIFFNLTSGVGHLVDPVADICTEQDIPMIFFSQPFSGHDWGVYPRLKRFQVKVDLVASSRYEDIIPHLSVINAMKRMKSTKILYLNSIDPRQVKSLEKGLWKIIHDFFGITVEFLSPDDMYEKYDSVDSGEAEALAGTWIDGAEKVIEPPREDIVKSARLFLALKQLMVERDAQALTINCLGMFSKGFLPAYPCLAFSQLNDMGLIGVCEGDLFSTVSQIIGTWISGRSGFVTDPLFDTSKNEVIHAHCVCATKMEGPEGPQSPYIIRTHMEDDKGVSLQVKLRPSQDITMFKLNPWNTMLLSQGTITDNIDSDRGCRTKFGTNVRDIQKMIDNWSGGLHRVIFYGDLTKELDILGKYMDIKIIRED